MFCAACGKQIADTALTCPKCEAPTARRRSNEKASPKSFGVAVSLCAVFGVAGIHHFYIGNILHGLVDLSLLVATIAFFIAAEATGNAHYALLAVLTLLADAIHSVFVFAKLIIGRQRDGSGRLIHYPGQAAS